jgi:hypothetical protein
MSSEFIKNLEDAYDLIKQANHKMINLWLQNTLFTWRWWLCLVLTIVPWTLWFIFRKKESTHRLLYCGVIAMLISSWLDVVGILFGLWSYHADLIPFSPSFIPWDFTLVPVITMFFLQFKPNFNPYLKSIVYTLIASFAFQPLMQWLRFYSPKHWKHYYSVPIFIFIYLTSNWFSKRIDFKKLQ